MAEKTELLGRPIDGDITHTSSDTKTQHDPQELLSALDELLATDGVESVKWEQYTPYFNDGEPCVFSVGEVRAKITGGGEEDGDYEDGYVGAYDLYSYKSEAEVAPGTKRWEDINKVFSYAGKDSRALYEALRKGASVIGGGHHNVILQQKMGDHAVVIATPEGFSVDYYEHD